MQEALYKSGIWTHGRTREAELKRAALDRSAVFQRPVKMNSYFLYWEQELKPAAWDRLPVLQRPLKMNSYFL
jgi:acyl-CoA thioesterase